MCVLPVVLERISGMMRQQEISWCERGESILCKGRLRSPYARRVFERESQVAILPPLENLAGRRKNNEKKLKKEQKE